MYYFIYAYPEMYGGLHGMYSYDLVDCSDFEEACETGREMAREVIEDYQLEEEIYTEEDYMEEFNTDFVDDEYYDLLDQAIQEECAYQIYHLKDGCTFKDYLNWQQTNMPPEDFIHNFCKQITEENI